MRVLWITHSTLGEGGTLCQTASRGTVNALSNIGWEVVILSNNSNNSINQTTIDGFDWFHIPSFPIRGLQSIMLEYYVKNPLRKVLAMYNFDLAIVNWSLCRTVIPITSRLGIPVIVDDRSPPVHEDIIGRLQWIHYSRSWKYASKRASGFSFNSPALRNMIKVKYNLDGPCCVYPSATNPENFSKAELSNDEPMMLVYHGLLDRERSVWSLVEASDELRENGHEIRLMMFGEGNDQNRLEQASIDRNWFELLPSCPANEVPNRLSRAHIGVIPLPDSYQWSFSSPLKLFEYAASGLNVIATDIPCHQLLGERSWLKLVSCQDIGHSIAIAVGDIIANPEQWRNDSQEAWRQAQKEFSWDNSVASLNDLMRIVIQ